MPKGALRCPHCMGAVPRGSFLDRIRSSFSRKVQCRHCARRFSRGLGEQVAILYNNILSDFENRLAAELKGLPVSGRAEVLVQFGMHMEDAKIASPQMLLRSLGEILSPQLAGLARGYEGHLHIRQVTKGNCTCCDIDAMVEDGSHSRQRLRIARVESRGFIQVDLNHLRDPRRTQQTAQ